MPEEFRDGNYGFGNPTTPADKDVTEAQLNNISSVEETAYGSDVGFYDTNYVPPSGSSQSIPQDDVRYRQEHEPYNYQPDGDQFVYITKAHLHEIHPLTLGLIKRHELTPLKIKLDSAKGCVYTQFKTTDQGKIEGEYELLKTDEDDPPDSVPFALPDGNNNAGTGGTYNVLLFKFANGEIIRNHYSTDEEGAVDPRSVKHYGGVEGHRGPLFWSCGYNRIKNVGTGDGKIFKDYTISSDSKNLRTLKEADYSDQSTPFSTDPQINIETSGDEITVRGNSLNEEWTTTAASGVSGYSNSRIAVVQDGLIKEKTNLEVVEVSESTGSGTTVNTVSSVSKTDTTVDTLQTTEITPPSGSGMSLNTKTYTVRELSTESLSQQANAWQGGSTIDTTVDTLQTTQITPPSGSGMSLNTKTYTVRELSTESLSQQANAWQGGSTTPAVVETLQTTEITPPSGSGMSLDTKTYTVRQLSTETLSQQAGAWHGGSSTQSGGLNLYEVNTTAGATIWVMGKASTGGSPPTFPSFITGASTYTGVTGLSESNVTLYKAHSSGNHKYLESSESDTTTNNVYFTDATTARTFITSTGTPIHVYSESGSTTNKFFKTNLDDSTLVTLITGASTYTGVKNLSESSVELYKAHSSGNHKYLESSESDTTTNNVYFTGSALARTFITSTGSPIHVYSESGSTTHKFLKTDESDGATVSVVNAVNTASSTLQTVTGSVKVLKAP